MPVELTRVLQGDPEAVRALVDETTPVVQARVVRALLRRRQGALGRDLRQEVQDLVQEVYLALFDDQSRALRTWSPDRGLSLANFIGLVAERQVASILRSGRRSPFTEDPTDADVLVDATGGGPPIDAEVVSRNMLEQLLDRMRATLSPKGLQIFQLLYVEERSVEEICIDLSMSAEAVYAWRSRLGKHVRKLAAELDPASSGKMVRAKASAQNGAS